VLAVEEIVGPGQWTQKRRERRGIVEVLALRQDAQRVGAQAEARSAKAARSSSRGALDGRLGVGDLALDLVARIGVKPGLVRKGVVADLVAGIGDRAHGRRVLRERGV